MAKRAASPEKGDRGSDHDHTHDHADGSGHDHDHGHGHGTDGAGGDGAGGSGGGGGAEDRGSHGHTHEHMDHPGRFEERERSAPSRRDLSERAFTVGIGGPVGSGKTALMLALCRALRDDFSIVAIANDIFTREDGEFLLRNDALPAERIRAIETGGCPHAAIRDDVTANLVACEEATVRHEAQIVLLESGGDNLAANFSRELADYTIYVIDVAGGDKVPRKGGPGITQSDLLIVNKTDLASVVGASVDVMRRDAKVMRGDGPTIFAQVKHGVGVDDVVAHILADFRKLTATSKKARRD